MAMEIDARLLDPNGEPELIENFNRVMDAVDKGSGGSSVVIDSTLSKSGQAADAKAAGDRIKSVEAKTKEATASAPGIMSVADKSKLDGIAANANNYALPAATTGALGGVRKSAAVAKAAADTVTQAEFNALIDALVAAGIMEAGA